jgi:hypothetical protein
MNFLLEATKMKGAKLFVLLSSLLSGGFGLDNTKYPWTTPEDENSQKNMTSASASVLLNNIQNLQILSTTRITSFEVATTPEVSSSEESLQSTLPPSKTRASSESLRNPVLTSTEKTEERVVKLENIAFPTKSSIKFSPGAETVVLSNATLKFLQSFARTSNQQAVSLQSVGSVGNRSPRETYLSQGNGSGSQRPGYQKSSFETTRGK